MKKTKILGKNDFFKFKKELFFVEELDGSVWNKDPKKRNYRQFIYHLARELGKTVEEILELSASEINEWESYFSIYPFTFQAQDTHAALLAMVIANSSGNVKKPLKLEDFLPDY